MKTLRVLAVILVFGPIIGPRPVSAQQPVLLQPTPRATVNSSGTIAATGVFQSVFASGQTNRVACTVQNNGTASEWVFFGPIASATTGKSVLLQPGASVSCNGPGVTLSDQVSITGTINDTFYAGVQ